MNKLKYFLAVIVILVVGLFGTIAVYTLIWQLSSFCGFPFLEHEFVSAIFLIATLIAMFWAGNKFASFNKWPLSGEPSLEQLSELGRLDSVVFRASRAVEVKLKKENTSGFLLEVGKGKVIFIEVPLFAILGTYATDEEDLSLRTRLFPSSKFEIHFDTIDRSIKRIDCLGDNLEIQECFPIIKKARAFARKYPQSRLTDIEWDEMLKEMKQLTSKSMRRP